METRCVERKRSLEGPRRASGRSREEPGTHAVPVEFRGDFREPWPTGGSSSDAARAEARATGSREVPGARRRRGARAARPPPRPPEAPRRRAPRGPRWACPRSARSGNRRTAGRRRRRRRRGNPARAAQLAQEARVDAGGTGEGAQARFLGPRPADDEGDRAALAREGSDRVDEHVEALDGHQATEERDDGTVGIEAEGPPRARRVDARGPRPREGRGVDAHGDHRRAGLEQRATTSPSWGAQEPLPQMLTDEGDVPASASRPGHVDHDVRHGKTCREVDVTRMGDGQMGSSQRNCPTT